MSIIAKEYRGEVLDLEFYGHIAVADTDGKILSSYGEPGRVSYARSSAKPFYALTYLASGIMETYGFSDKELAVFCASHNGESFHTRTVLSVLETIGLDESYLQCGIHEPTSDRIRVLFRETGVKPGPAHNNCSGKHAGMLATTLIQNLDPGNYTDLSHPVQQAILRALAEVCDYPVSDIRIGIDGCGAPVHALPLYKFAQGFARMANPGSLGPTLEARARRITSAMTRYPEMVAGTGDFVTALMGAFGDRLFCKSGANGFFAIGLFDRGMGITVKLEDGGAGGMPMIVMEILAQLGLISREESLSLPGFTFSEGTRQRIKNHRGDIVGWREPAFHM